MTRQEAADVLLRFSFCEDLNYLTMQAREFAVEHDIPFFLGDCNGEYITEVLERIASE